MKKKILLSLIVAVFLTAGCGGTATFTSADKAPTYDTPAKALAHLQQGNKQYTTALSNTNFIDEPIRHTLFKKGQHPYAMIITCSDSRVVPENIFFTGPGELFVARTAGNVIGKFELGTVEYAIEDLKVPVIIVMGHQNCGAVTAAFDMKAEGYLKDILDEIHPSVIKAKSLSGVDELSHAIDFNVEHSIDVINQSEVVKTAVQEGKVKVIGANYNLETGKVRLLK